jgi:plasmid replication initiation protein
MSKTTGIVVRANDLIRASHSLKLSEQKLMYLVLLQVKPDQLEYTVSTSSYSAAYDLTRQAGYQALSEASDSLFNQTLVINEGKGKRRLHWVSSVYYANDLTEIKIRFSNEIMPFLVELKERFTIITIDQIKQFKSSHTLRIYEWCKSHESQRGFEISVKEIRERLCLSDDYRQDNIQTKIIKPAIAQINLGDLVVSYEVVKQGIQVQGYKFAVGQPVRAKTVKPAKATKAEIHSKPPSFKLH